MSQNFSSTSTSVKRVPLWTPLTPLYWITVVNTVSKFTLSTGQLPPVFFHVLHDGGFTYVRVRRNCLHPEHLSPSTTEREKRSIGYRMGLVELPTPVRTTVEVWKSNQRNPKRGGSGRHWESSSIIYGRRGQKVYRYILSGLRGDLLHTDLLPRMKFSF